MESELFGHERGAFTGAQTQRAGRFTQADGGTLFLDEIGDMPVDLQTRLLRVLSDGQFYRVGGREPVSVNVRVITATHQDLARLVREKTFREDLFHRLNVIRLQLPPLRERPQDIPVLTRHFLAKSAAALGVEPKRLSDATMAFIQTLPFPGNVRQLENLCHWLTVMVASQTVERTDLPEDLWQKNPETNVNEESWTAGLTREIDRLLLTEPGKTYDNVVGQVEKLLIDRALNAAHGNRLKAAQLLGIGRNTLARKVG
jgi:two-component system nitrogen regulation response regulator GlnG